MKYFKIALLLITLISSSTFSIAESQKTQLTNVELKLLLSKAETNFSKIQTIKTLFTQEKNLSLFSEKIISKGFCIFKAPDKLRLEFTKPFKSALIINITDIYKYEHIDKNWHKLSPGNKEIMLIIMKNITSWLTGKFNDPKLYDIKAYKNKDNTSIILIPKNKDFRKFISSFELGLNKKIDSLKYIIINEKKKDYTKIEFHDDIIDGKVNEKVFSGKANKPQDVERW